MGFNFQQLELNNLNFVYIILKLINSKHLNFLEFFILKVLDLLNPLEFFHKCLYTFWF